MKRFAHKVLALVVMAGLVGVAPAYATGAPAAGAAAKPDFQWWTLVGQMLQQVVQSVLQKMQAQASGGLGSGDTAQDIQARMEIAAMIAQIDSIATEIERKDGVKPMNQADFDLGRADAIARVQAKADKMTSVSYLRGYAAGLRETS